MPSSLRSVRLSLVTVMQTFRGHRMVGLGYIGDRLFSVVSIDRGEERRIISLRKANQREVKRYAET